MLFEFQKSLRARNLQHVYDALVFAEAIIEHARLRCRFLFTGRPAREKERIPGDVQLD